MKIFSISILVSTMLYVSSYGQNVGIGTNSPIDKLTIQTATNSFGITHTDGTVRLSTYLGSGSSGAWLGTQTNHSLSFFTNNSSQRLTIATDGNVGIGVVAPGATLDVARSTGSLGTAVFRGTANFSHFNYSTAEDTYIRGGKSSSNVVINDVGANVGIGVSDPIFKLDVGNRMRLRSQGTGGVTAGLWLNNYDNSGYTGFIGDVGPGAPNHMGFFGSTSGWHLVMNTVSGNVGINTFNTAGVNSNAKLNISGNAGGHAIKLFGNNQYISFYDGGDNYKGYVWNPGNNIEIGTDVSNATGEVNLKTKGVQGLSIQSDGRVRVGDLACTIPVDGALPKLSLHGPLGFKKPSGDQIGEWAILYEYAPAGNSLSFRYNGGLKAFISEADGSWHTYSDDRLKQGFENYKPVLNGIKNLNILTYQYKDDKKSRRCFGLIAQNVQQYFPEIVSVTNSTGNLLALDYSKTGVLAIKAIQEQQQIIESQQKKIEELEKRLERVEKKLGN